MQISFSASAMGLGVVGFLLVYHHDRRRSAAERLPGAYLGILS
jgi:hypothetical protein